MSTKTAKKKISAKDVLNGNIDAYAQEKKTTKKRMSPDDKEILKQQNNEYKGQQRPYYSLKSSTLAQRVEDTFKELQEQDKTKLYFIRTPSILWIPKIYVKRKTILTEFFCLSNKEDTSHTITDNMLSEEGSFYICPDLTAEKLMFSRQFVESFSLPNNQKFEPVIHTLPSYYQTNFSFEREVKMDTLELDDNQKAAIDSAIKYLEKDKTYKRIVFNLGTGFGKTILALVLANSIRIGSKKKSPRIYIIVHTKQLMEQWGDQLKLFFPDKNVLLFDSSLTSKKSKPTYEDFMEKYDIVISLPKMATRRSEAMFETFEYTEEQMQSLKGNWYNHFDVCLVDEVHKHTSVTQRVFVTNFSKKFIFSLSATISENEYVHKFIHFFMGKVINKETLKQEGYAIKDARYDYNIEKININYLNPQLYAFSDESILCRVPKRATEVISTTLLNKKICSDPLRAIYIAKTIAEAAKEGRNILVLSTTIAYLDLIREYYLCLINERPFFTLHDPVAVRSNVDKPVNWKMVLNKSLDNKKGNAYEFETAEYVIDGKKSVITKTEEYKDLVENDLYNSPVIVYGTDKAKYSVKEETNKSNIILSTYQFLGTGSDITRLDTLILAQSRISYIQQYCGRIMRQETGIKRVIYDFVDCGSTTLLNQARNRESRLPKDMFDCKESVRIVPDIQSKSLYNNFKEVEMGDYSKFEDFFLRFRDEDKEEKEEEKQEEPGVVCKVDF